MFKSRQNQSVFKQFRAFMLPRRGWQRPWQYIVKRTLRIAASPHAIAIGFAVGVFASFTPFVGGHIIICLALAWLLGGSIIASMFGSIVGNPLTFPFIWAATHRLGTMLLGGRGGSREPDLTRGIFERSFEAIWPLIKPMFFGGLVLGTIAAVISYYIVRTGVAAYQAKRAARINKVKADGLGSTQ